ncbi:MAG TPA: hypothetical protein PK705_09635 [Clostridia bacterium]|nr:hypothetical protein [Clostridia bacterium]
MEIKSYNLTLTENEIIAIHKTLGGLNDSEFERAGIAGEERELLRNIYNELSFIHYRKS